MELEVTILVTDKNVRFLGDDPERADIAQAVLEAVRYNSATSVEIRKVKFEVELLKAPQVTDVHPNIEIAVTPDITEALTAAARSRGEGLQDALIHAFPEGKYTVERTSGMISITRV